ncbi:MAG: HAD family hydrolase [Deltaproteobacteria bacterium]|nr:HAD family hydrolase [Deltaproteobacteria bacterium]
MNLRRAAVATPRYRAIVWDLDSTLVDPRADMRNAARETLRHFGGLPGDDRSLLGFAGGRRAFFANVLPHLNGRLGEAVAFYNAWYHAHCLDRTTLIPGVLDTVTALYAAGLPQAVFTNNHQPDAERIVEGLGLRACFACILGAESGFPRKPDPTGMHHLLGQMRVSSPDALMIGDGLIDVEAAQRARMDCALVENGYASDATLQTRLSQIGLDLRRPAGRLRFTFPELRTFLLPT